MSTRTSIGIAGLGFSALIAVVGCGGTSERGPGSDAAVKDDAAPTSAETDASDAGDGAPPVAPGDAAVTPADFPVLATAPGLATYTFMHDGLVRTFMAYVPKGAPAQAPLMIVLHGGGGSAAQMFEQHDLASAADTVGFVMVAAQGTPKQGETNAFDWNGQVLLDSGIDDVGYLERVVLGVTARLDIDARRRYVAGFSGGASMTIRFGASRSGLIAAIGTFAGKVGLSDRGAPFVYPPAPTTPISVQLTYGTADPNYEGEAKGDIQATSAIAGTQWWASALGCGPSTRSMLSAKQTLDTFPACTGDVVVRMLTVEGMPHTWPTKAADGIDGTKLLIEFFIDKSRP